jgi:hypothetical protein
MRGDQQQLTLQERDCHPEAFPSPISTSADCDSAPFCEQEVAAARAPANAKVIRAGVRQSPEGPRRDRFLIGRKRGFSRSGPSITWPLKRTTLRGECCLLGHAAPLNATKRNLAAERHVWS